MGAGPPRRRGVRHALLAQGRRKEPVGVVGAITPWNYPFEITINKLGQALATGNTVVLKPAPDTPWTGTRFGRLIAEKTDIPAGVVNVVTSSDHMLGEQLVTDPRVDLISFTGSTATGRRIMEKGAADPEAAVPRARRQERADIMLDDADFAASLAMASLTVCTHAGQGCAMPTRMLLPRSRYDEGLELVAGELRGRSATATRPTPTTSWARRSARSSASASSA